MILKWFGLALVITLFTAGLVFLNLENEVGMITCFILMGMSALTILADQLYTTFTNT